MPKLGSLNPGKFWKADSLNGGTLVLTISSWGLEEVGEKGERKYLLRFEEDPRALTINATREKQLYGLFGANLELDELPGKAIQLVKGMTVFKGDQVPCINIEKAPEADVPF